MGGPDAALCLACLLPCSIVSPDASIVLQPCHDALDSLIGPCGLSCARASSLLQPEGREAPARVSRTVLGCAAAARTPLAAPLPPAATAAWAPASSLRCTCPSLPLSTDLPPHCSGVRIKTRKRNIVVPHDPQVRRRRPTPRRAVDLEAFPGSAARELCCSPVLGCHFVAPTACTQHCPRGPCRSRLPMP